MTLYDMRYAGKSETVLRAIDPFSFAFSVDASRG
jgi:hypothetical protein